jgi:hypothetical protein
MEFMTAQESKEDELIAPELVVVGLQGRSNLPVL